MCWLRLAALASAAAVLALALFGKPPFREVYGRGEALEGAQLIESSLGPAQRVVFFEVNSLCVCSARLEGSPSLESFWGKEWVVRGYRGVTLLYELRIDASLGFSSLSINLAVVNRAAALTAVARLLRRSGGGVFLVEEAGSLLAVSAWKTDGDACRSLVLEAERWRGAVALVWVIMQAVQLTGLLLAVALPIPGVRKANLAILTLPLIVILGLLSAVLQMQYLLGKHALPPAPRFVFNLLYNSALFSINALISLIAGTALRSKGSPLTLPAWKRVVAKWLDGVAVGMILAALMGVLLTLLEKWGRVIPLRLSALENALTVQGAWIAAALHLAVASLVNAATFRFLLPLLLREILRGEGQGVVAASAIYSLTLISATFYPPHTDVLAALTLSLAICLLYLWRGLLAAVAAEYTYNALAYALSISSLLPADALLLALTPLQGTLLAPFIVVLTRRVAG